MTIQHSKKALLALFLASCQTGEIYDHTGPNIDEDVAIALSALPRVEVTAAENGVPTFIRGDLGFVSTQRQITEADLAPAMDMLAPVFRLESGNLRLLRATEDGLGLKHARYAQTKNGLEVIGGELLVHVDHDGSVYAVNGNARDGVLLPPNPALDSGAARVRATELVPGTQATDANLVYVVSTKDHGLHLAWETVVAGFAGDDPIMDRVYVDALDGSLVDRHPMIHTAKARRVHTSGNGSTLPGTLVRSEGGAASSDTAVNNGYDYSGATYDCYKTLFDRDSYNNAGATLTVSVHYSRNYNNAFWNGSQMVFGDGDGSTFSSLVNSFDVMAHELTHAVTGSTADLIYQNESGALNEAMSDIMAATCETWKTGGTVNANTWKIGEDIFTPGTAGDALRYMDNPTADGMSYDFYPERYTGFEDSGGVHLNSGIANLAFKLLVTGGTHPRSKTSVTVPALGMDKTSRIFYRALTQYMTSTTDFAGARTATAQAATDLYDATTAAAVQAAWDAVGVPGGTGGGGGGGGATTALTNGTALTGKSGAAGSETFYSLDVPAGATGLKFQTSGGTGDADLYVKFGSKPTTAATDKSDGGTNAETVNIATAQAGTYYVLVKGYAAYSGLSVVGSFTAGGGGGGGGGETSVLENGVGVSAAGAQGSMKVYTFQVPAGASALTFATSGGTGDLDLYVKFGAAPTTTSYDYRPYKDGNNETVNATTATAGTWYVMVHGYTAFSGATLKASYSNTPSNQLQDGVTVSGLSAASGGMLRYTVVVPTGVTSLSIAMSGGTGDADLYVKRGTAPTTSSYDYRPYLDGNNETVSVANPVAGTYHVMIHAYSAFSGLSIVANY
jgi:Zn-dependent metalloprotease